MLFDALQHLGLRNFNNSSAAWLLSARLLRLSKVSVNYSSMYSRRVFAALSPFQCVRFYSSVLASQHPTFSPAPESLSRRSHTSNHPVLFWVKCKAKRCGTRWGCTGTGCHGDGRAVFSAVVLLRPALRFQLGEEGRVRTVPTRPRWKMGQHLAPALNKILQLPSWILKPVSQAC